VTEGPDPGEYDERRHRAEFERLLSDSRERGWDAAYDDALHRDLDALGRDETALYGSVAAGLLLWITSHWSDAAALQSAHELMYGSNVDDPRRKQVLDLTHRIATGTITWTELARVEKKGLIRREVPKLPPPPADAIPLGEALTTLTTMLGDAGVDDERPDPRGVWNCFAAFAGRPVAGTPLIVENDMCLFEWGIHDFGEGRSFEWDLTRQFVLNDGDGDYDHMEQLSVTLSFDPEDADLVSVGAGNLWSGNDLDEWRSDVERLDAFRAVDGKAPRRYRLSHSEV
jgi:hypothetical protein